MGHIVSKEGVRIDSEMVEAIKLDKLHFLETKRKCSISWEKSSFSGGSSQILLR
jgi:hypothetical protein